MLKHSSSRATPSLPLPDKKSAKKQAICLYWTSSLPARKPLYKPPKNNRIGIIATNTTVNSNAYARAIHSQNNDTLVRTQAAPLLVPLVEEGWLDHEVTRLTVREYLKPLLADDIDTLVLGCTHFPLLKPLIGREAQNVTLVDSAITTAEATAKALAQAGLLNTENDNPDYRFYVSDIPLRFRTIGERFLGRSMEQIEMVTLG